MASLTGPYRRVVRVHVVSAAPCQYRGLPPQPSIPDWEAMEVPNPHPDLVLKATCAQDLVAEGPFLVHAHYRGAMLYLNRGLSLQRRDDSLESVNGHVYNPQDGATEKGVMTGRFEDAYDVVVRFEFAAE